MSYQKKQGGWQKFSSWASRSFGCTSSYTIKDNDISNNMRTKKTLVNRGTVETTGLSDVDQTGQSSTKKSNKVGEWQTNGNVSERSFSKNQEEMPYIDASMVNINQAVK